MDTGAVILTSFLSTIPVYLFFATGFYLRHKQVIQADHDAPIMRIAMDVAYPCLVFHSIMKYMVLSGNETLSSVSFSLQAIAAGALELLLGIVYSIILNWKVNQVYPWLKSEVKQGKLLFKKYPEVTRYTKQLFVHKLGSFVQFQTTPFLVYAFVSLKTVAYYGNYTLIIDKISIFISNLLGSTNAGVGNLIAEGDSKRIQQVFWELMGIRFLIAGTISFALIRLTGAFISLWLGSEYVLPQHILYLIIINSFISYTRGAIDQFTYGYGLFQDTWAPIAEVIINLTVAIIAGHFWGLPGILMGNITSLFLIIVIWKPYFLYSQGFKIPVLHYWMGYIKHLLIILLPGIVCYHLYPSNDFTPESSFTHWILYGMILISTYGILTCSLLYLFTPGIRAFAHRILKRHH